MFNLFVTAASFKQIELVGDHTLYYQRGELNQLYCKNVVF